MLEKHGWEAAQDELLALSKAGEWDKMGELFDDTMLATFAIVAEPDDVARRVIERYGDVVTRLSPMLPYRHGSTVVARLLPDFA